MKKIGLVLGLVIPIMIALPVDAKNARRISVKTASSIPTSTHSLSGRATKKSHIKLVVGKHVLGKTNANSLGKFKIKLKHRLSLNKKYYLIASKKGYKQSKVLISLYKVEKNKNVKNATSNIKIPSPTTSSSNGASKPNTPKYVTSPGGKVTESASAPFENGLPHSDGDVWYVTSGSTVTAMYKYSNGSWNLILSDSTSAPTTADSGSSKPIINKNQSKIDDINTKILNIKQQINSMSPNVQALTFNTGNSIDSLKEDDYSLVSEIAEYRRSQDRDAFMIVNHDTSLLQRNRRTISDYEDAVSAANGDVQGYIAKYHQLEANLSILNNQLLALK
ncbi:hypothetical protein [Levilactobacillus spicheri]|uniref:Bacterial Ig domain-containing protein n=2 Tax=Levilactobacillus spicheri TaxID=216463 RepID=A0ABQ0WMP4_9LACO|nr:hypothetical protein [Levilactobacillus spicheri]KRL50269.1 hypothetical protein FD37_GL001932 [Levilactobacillus spicheri DSM 15429]GEO66221.1 hypothetical protein LSP04_06400 [Levilactobacillus spicheri]